MIALTLIINQLFSDLIFSPIIRSFFPLFPIHLTSHPLLGSTLIRRCKWGMENEWMDILISLQAQQINETRNSGEKRWWWFFSPFFTTKNSFFITRRLRQEKKSIRILFLISFSHIREKSRERRKNFLSIWGKKRLHTASNTYPKGGIPFFHTLIYCVRISLRIEPSERSFPFFRFLYVPYSGLRIISLPRASHYWPY